MIHVVLPAYNEARDIRSLLRAIAEEQFRHDLDLSVVVVDDGSTDATVAEAERAVEDTAGRLRLTVITHEANSGLGAALRTGIDWCLDHGDEGDIMVTLDADNTHPPALIGSLVAEVERGHDLAIASRYRPGSRIRGVPRSRRILSDGARLVLQTMFPIRGVRDYTCCFRAIRLSTLRRARAVYGDDLTTARGFEAVMDLLLRLRQLGVTASEIPLDLDYTERVGRSKMRLLVTIRRTMVLLAHRFVERFTTWSPERVAARLAAVDPVGGTGRQAPAASPRESGS